MGADDSALAEAIEVGIGGEFALAELQEALLTRDLSGVVQFREDLAGGFRAERYGESLAEEGISIGCCEVLFGHG
jgi:hypothetical protein